MSTPVSPTGDASRRPPSAPTSTNPQPTIDNASRSDVDSDSTRVMPTNRIVQERTVVHHQSAPPPPVPPAAAAPPVPDAEAVIARQKERFGGMKGGSAFFGWLTATGTAVLLLALLTAAGVGLGYASSETVDQAVQEAEGATSTAQTVGLVGGIVLLVVLFVAYFCGGYVAGRMARFNGPRQGVAVWLWGVVMALVIAGLAAIAGSQYNIFAALNLPRLPVGEGAVTTTAIIAIVAALLAALVGAILGGATGMRFHRKVDRAALHDLESHTNR